MNESDFSDDEPPSKRQKINHSEVMDASILETWQQQTQTLLIQ